MAFPITCPTCGKAFTLADDIYEKKVAGKVVSIKCRQCQSGIRIDATHPGDLRVVGATPAGGANVSVGAKPPGAGSAALESHAEAPEPPTAAPRPHQPTLIGIMNPAGEVVSPGFDMGASGTAWAVDSGGIGDDRELSDDEMAREIAQGKLKPDTLVWREGQGEWQEIKNIPSLAKHLPPPKQPLIKPKPAPEAKSAPIVAKPEPELPPQVEAKPEPKLPPQVEAQSEPKLPTPAESKPDPTPVAAPAAKVASPVAPKVVPAVTPRVKEPSAAGVAKPATPEGAPRARLPSATGLKPGAPAPAAKSPAMDATMPGTPRAKQPSAAGLPPPRTKQPSAAELPPARAKQPSAAELPPPRGKQPSAADLPPARGNQPSAADLPPPRAKQPSADVTVARTKLPSGTELAIARAMPRAAPPAPATPAAYTADEDEATAIYDRSSPEAAAALAALGFGAETASPEPPALRAPPPPAAGRAAPPRQVSPAPELPRPPAPPPLPRSAPAAAAPPPIPAPAAPWGQLPAQAVQATSTPMAPALPPVKETLMGPPPMVPAPMAPAPAPPPPMAPAPMAPAPMAPAPMAPAPIASAPMAPARVASAPIASAPLAVPQPIIATADLDFPAPKSKMPLVVVGIVGVAALVGIIVAVSSGSPPPPPPPPAVATPATTPQPAATPAPGPTNTPVTPPSPIENTPSGRAATPAPGGGFSDLFAAGAEKAGTPGAARAFDMAEARKAVAAVLPSVARCKEPGGAVGQSTAAITFESNGSVSSVTVGAPFSGSSTGTCIIGALKAAKVKPFSGLPGTVSHPVSLR